MLKLKFPRKLCYFWQYVTSLFTSLVSEIPKIKTCKGKHSITETFDLEAVFTHCGGNCKRRKYHLLKLQILIKKCKIYQNICWTVRKLTRLDTFVSCASPLKHKYLKLVSQYLISLVRKGAIWEDAWENQYVDSLRFNIFYYLCLLAACPQAFIPWETIWYWSIWRFKLNLWKI